VIARKHRRALDSTVLDDAVARQDTITTLAVQIRKVRKLVPGETVGRLAQGQVRGLGASTSNADDLVAGTQCRGMG
jgi:hypothetical protein